jgi:hypothetical protein
MIKRNLYQFICLLLGVFLLAPSTVLAISASQRNIFDTGIYYFDAASTSGYCGFSGSNFPTGSNGGGGMQSDAQIQIAKIIMGIAKTDNLDQSAGLIGLMVGLDESHLTILANSNVPISESNPNKQGDGSNGHSVGVFQQQPQYGWSTIATGQEALTNKDAVWQLMDPAYAAEAFFGSPPGSNAPPALKKGLQNVSGWQGKEPWVAAQAVQNSGDSSGSNYKEKINNAQSLIDKYWNDAAAVTLPVAFSGGEGTSGSGSPSCVNSTNCGVDHPVYGSVNGQGSEYSQQQLAQLFGDPGTGIDHSAMQNKQVKVNFVGHGVNANPLIAQCLSAVSEEIQASGISYQINSVGCYRFDSDNGTTNIGLKSYHTYGVACDINPDTNPFVESGQPSAHDMPQSIVDAFNHHGFTWGGNWRQPKDYMHFEFNGLSPP